MLKLITSIVGCIYVAALLGEGDAIRCFHCYESFNKTLSLRSTGYNVYGERFLRCDKNKNNWDTWVCPREYPICVIMMGEVRNHVEIIRTCAEKDVCSTYKPPQGATVKACRECSTDLCNEYVELPTPPPPPPVEPDATFNFNINLNLDVKKNPRINGEDIK